MTKLTITKIIRKPQVSAKTGKPYESLSLLTTEYATRWLSGFGSKETAGWKEGMVIEVDVEESEKLDKNGKPYLNWSIKKENPVMDKIARIEFSIANIHRKIDEIVSQIKKMQDNGLTSAGTVVPNFTPNTPQEAQAFKEKMELYEDENAELDMLAEERFEQES